MDPKFIGFGYSAPRGCVGFLNENNQYESFHSYSSPNIALGLSFINYYSYHSKEFGSPYISVYSLGSHIYVDKKVSIINDGSFNAYIRTRHYMSDSNSIAFIKSEKKNPIMHLNVIKSDFPFLPIYMYSEFNCLDNMG